MSNGEPQKTRSVPMLIVIDSSGAIVAAAHEASNSKKGHATGIGLLPEQQAYRIDVPEAILALESGHDFHQALIAHVNVPGHPSLKPERKLTTEGDKPVKRKKGK